jgi:hypothetical protein
MHHVIGSASGWKEHGLDSVIFEGFDTRVWDWGLGAGLWHGGGQGLPTRVRFAWTSEMIEKGSDPASSQGVFS